MISQYFSRGQTNSGTLYFYEFTHRGDVVGVTSNSGAQITAITYDTYGRPTILPVSFIPDFGFTGLYLHQRSGLNLAVYRAYSSSLGRWTSRDPLEEDGGVNLFAYVNNNPINFRDPNGTIVTVALTNLGGLSGPPIPSPQPSPSQPNVCPYTPNDLHNKCRKWCYDNFIEWGWEAVANCIWYICKKYTGDGGG